MSVRKYTRLFLAQLRASFLVALQYRADFVMDGAIEVVWTSTALAPLLVVFGLHRGVAGWAFGEALVVVGFFTLLQALMEGAMNPSFAAVVEHVRRGSMDHVLMKPADAQFLVSTARFHPWRAVNVLTALAMFVVAFRSLQRVPSATDVLAAVLLFFAAAMLLHAFWTLATCTVFYAVRTDNLTDVFSAVFDAARWPSSVFRGAVRIVLTFVVPLGLMTTVPAQALLGALDVTHACVALAEAALLSVFARMVWTRAVGRYTSASS
jgi:ABC-2 type transport system permease protein